MHEIKIYTDGACAPSNPGPMGIGFFIPDIKLACWAQKGEGTNNQAEYLAVMEAIKYFKNIKAFSNDHLKFITDSLLVVNQINGDWKIKEKTLESFNKSIIQELDNLIKESKIKSYSFVHVRREYNLVADALSKYALQ